MPKKGEILPKEEPGDPSDPLGFASLRNRYVEHLQIRNYSSRTVDNRRGYINRFIVWCEERDLLRPDQISKQILELYQKYLYVYRDPKTGRKLSFRTQSVRLVQLRGFFSWLCK